MFNVPTSQFISPASPPARNQSSRWIAFASLTVAIVAIGAAIGAWLRPLPKYEPPPAPTYSNQQASSATVKVCAAHTKVQQALTLSADRDGGNDPIAILTVATSGRQVLDAGSRYLLSTLSESPATQPELEIAIRKLASAYQQITITYLSGAANSDPELPPMLDAADDAISAIERLCG
ncbi:hypothetical protein [Mycobacterium asiaticum]|uniref:hypothetical protein n=1 Tax=Mycobacterium asiaticum TaxID=1790 RepID=UPI0012DB4801|nr:hypothetical protein [Mycobacterium asiaticum]